jgi:hypothetical protein
MLASPHEAAYAMPISLNWRNRLNKNELGKLGNSHLDRYCAIMSHIQSHDVGKKMSHIYSHERVDVRQRADA